MKKKKYKYYQINLWVIPDIENNLEDLSYTYIREYLQELLNTPQLVLSIPRETAEEFFNTNGYSLKRFHSNKAIYDKWKVLPRGIKKRLYYLVNKKLLEVLNDTLQTAHPPS
jgi:hypothetical protein